MSPRGRVLLVSPPWRVPTQGTLAIATLRPILEAAGFAVSELHGPLLFPQAGRDLESLFQDISKFAFGRALDGRDLDAYVEDVVACVRAEANMRGLIAETGDALGELGIDPAGLARAVRRGIELAEQCLERMVERALAGGPVDVLAFSTMWTDQVPAAIITARRLRAAWPGVRVVFGGSACFEEQAEGLMASFGDIDVACHGEGDEVVVPLMDALLGRGALAAVPGIAWRDGATVRKNPSPPLLRSLDGLPIPDYGEFVRQLEVSAWAAGGAQLFFETSRGCWWGEKSLCTFCGLNAEGLPFRAKSPQRAYDEIVALYRRHPTNSLLATDNILDLRYLTTLFPRLGELAAEPARPLRLFYEVKSNMKLEQVEAMAVGGVHGVQPGIESFSDGVLELMRKGCTGLGQVQFIKWSHQSGVEPFYNILVLNPGETPDCYQEMLALVPFLTHLPPPQAVVATLLERFSVYHADPAAFAIRNVRPKAFYRLMFGRDVDPRVAYQFDFDHDMFADAAHMSAARALVAALRQWVSTYRPSTLYYLDHGDRLTVVDDREGHSELALRGLAARLFTYVDQRRTRASIGEAFTELAPEVIDAQLDAWVHRRWVCRAGDRYLSVVPRQGPAAAAPKLRRRSAPQLHLPLAGGM